MNDAMADDLMVPAFEKTRALLEERGFDGAIVIGDGGEVPIEVTLEDYWASTDNGELSVSAEHMLADLITENGVTRWAFVTPASYTLLEGENGQEPMGTSHFNHLNAKMLWGLCYEEGAGYDVCGWHLFVRPNGKVEFADEIIMITSDIQLLDEAPGFTIMRDLLNREET